MAETTQATKVAFTVKLDNKLTKIVLWQ